MSSQESPSTGESPWDSECIAALLWNVPELLRGSGGAQAFRHALGPPPWRFEIDEDNPVGVAARALVAEQEGDVEGALASYLELGRSGAFWPALLGLFLAAFSSSPRGAESLAEAFRRVNHLAPSQLQARLLAKVAAFALDRNDQRIFTDALVRAVESADDGSHLKQTLQLVALNAGFPGIDLPALMTMQVERDPLVDLDWIDVVALHAARGELVDELKARARSPWSWQFRSGRTPTDEIISAEAQATWAGALWLRSELRRQLGAQVLRGSARNEPTLRYALTMWITGGGDNIGPVIELVEPQFGPATADDLVEPMIDAVGLPGIGDLRLAETAVATWDLLRDDLLRALLDRLPAVGGIAPDAEAIRQFWAYGSMRIADDVSTRLGTLAPSAQAEVVALMPMTGLEQISKQVAEHVLAAVGEAERVGGDLAGASLLLARRFDLPIPTFDLPPSELVEFIRRVPEAMLPEEARTAEAALRETLANEADAARAGTSSFGGRSTPLSLASISESAGAVDEKTVDLLLKIAADRETPAHLRLDCVVALARLARAGLLSEAAEASITRIPDSGTPSFFREVPSQLMHAARLLARARHLTEEERVAVLVLARDPDTVVRQFAVGAAGLAIKAEASPALEAAVIAGLYDPAPSVVVEALVALRGANFAMPGVLAAVIRRLPRLFDESGRLVRSETAGAARALLDRVVPQDRSQLAALLLQARSDRSWRVRQAVLEAPDS